MSQPTPGAVAAAEQHGLGAVEQTFVIGKGAVGFNIAVGVVGTALGVFFLTRAINAPSVVLVLVTLACLAVGIGSIVGASWLRKKGAEQVTLFENGVVYEFTQADAPKAARYTEARTNWREFEQKRDTVILIKNELKLHVEDALLHKVVLATDPDAPALRVINERILIGQGLR